VLNQNTASWCVLVAGLCKVLRVGEELAACNVWNMYQMLLISSGLICDGVRKESDLLPIV